MKLLRCAILIAMPAFAYGQAKGDIEVRHPWSRATPPGAKVGVAYMEIHNRASRPDRLLSATSAAAKRVEMHVTQRDGEVTKMRQVQSFEVPARERYALRPGGSHLMLVELVRPLKQGERFSITLRFERARELEVELEVQEMGSRHPRH
jgi:copper(I)-binding protein